MDGVLLSYFDILREDFRAKLWEGFEILSREDLKNLENLENQKQGFHPGTEMMHS